METSGESLRSFMSPTLTRAPRYGKCYSGIRQIMFYTLLDFYLYQLFSIVTPVVKKNLAKTSTPHVCLFCVFREYYVTCCCCF